MTTRHPFEYVTSASAARMPSTSTGSERRYEVGQIRGGNGTNDGIGFNRTFGEDIARREDITDDYIPSERRYADQASTSISQRMGQSSRSALGNKYLVRLE